MNILLPIITNVILALIIIGGICIGAKKGIKFESGKLLLVLGAGVGCYFLNPTLISLVSKIEFIANLPLALISSATFCLAFLVCYLIISIALKIFVKHPEQKHVALANDARAIKIKGINRKETRKLRRAERKLRKARKELIALNKGSKTFGAIFGALIAIFVGFALMLPTKATLDIVAQIKEDEQITNAYTYTIYGQIDEHVYDVSSLIIKE